MTGSTVPTAGALLLQFALGLVVFLANRHRLANQCFLLLSLTIDAWLGSLYLAFVASNPAVAEFAIRQASASGALYLAMLNLLRLSVRQKDWRDILRHSRSWLILTISVVALCQTKAFLRGAQMPHLTGGAPSPIYGPAVNLYAVFFVLAFIALIISYWRDLRKTTGGEHAELAFILIGAVSGVAVALLLAFTLDFLIGEQRSIWFAPFRVVFISLVIAYGIATRKILEVGYFLRHAMAYVLLVVYLLILYGFVWWLAFNVFAPLPPNESTSLAHIIAALIVAFAMAPARGISQRLADRLFVGTRRLDFQATL